MALPQLKSLEDCADFYQTVQPFMPQLYELPHKVVENLASPDALKHLYVQTNPLISGFAASLAFGFVSLVVSEINRNYSQVDRLWSLLPNFYVVHLAFWARLAGVPHSRIDLVAASTTLWSIRLTFNYWRKGGYSVGSEDYRWEIVKKQVPGVAWFIFNVTFISFYQSVLLFAFSCVPAYVILLSSQFETIISAADVVFFIIEAGLVLSEWVSDGQQWDYQTAKHQYLKDGKIPRGFKQADLDRGFLTSGLFAYSRHPNFFAEQMVWVVLYQWACFASKSLFNWTVAGSAALCLLFQGSTWLTELITADKYREYAIYQNQVGMFLPTSLKPYKAPAKVPKIIRTSELAKRAEEKEKQKKLHTSTFLWCDISSY